MVHSKRGLSIVEFMVGVAVGLLVVGGATKLFTDHIVSNKRLATEMRVNQDLRAAADIVARDLRRAGYWNDPFSGLPSETSAAASNPHLTGAGAITTAASTVTYSYARTTAGNTSGLDSNEYAGFRLQAVGSVNVLQMQDGQDSWQALTDPGTLHVSNFSIDPITPAITNDLSSYCSCLSRLTCTIASIANPASNPDGPPTLTIFSYQLSITGQSVSDSAITRTIAETVRVRNPMLTGKCPA